MNKETEKPSWCQPRHRVIRSFFAPIIRALCFLFYRGLRLEPIRELEGEPCLILYNHQTAFDQFFISLMKKDPVYHVATEDLFSNGWPSRLLEWLVAPIPIRKQVSDPRAVRLCVQVAREGGTIAMAPEGNRTFDGRTVYINPAVAKLARIIGLPLVLVRLEGGYGAHPRWSDVRRNGPLSVRVVEVISAEEVKQADRDALYQRICQALSVDESAPQPVAYKSRKTAEYLERLFYVCPSCGFTRFESHGRTIACTGCSMTAEYTEQMELKGVGGGFPFRSIREWYDFQQNYVCACDPGAYVSEPVYTDTAAVKKVLLYDRKEPLFRKGCVRLYGDRIVITDAMASGELPSSGAAEAASLKGDKLPSSAAAKAASLEGSKSVKEQSRSLILPFAETTTITVAGRNKVNIYCRSELYQLKGSWRFNAVRYMNLFYRFDMKAKGREDDKFLGL